MCDKAKKRQKLENKKEKANDNNHNANMVNGIKNITLITLLVLFIYISIIYVSPENRYIYPGLYSFQLSMKTTQDGDTVRTDYVDENGSITLASDVGYATKLITQNNNTEYEEYLDESGRPISIDSGYSAIRREYDDIRNSIKVIYLDKSGEPVNTSRGYAIEEQILNEKGQIYEVKYYDIENHPVLNSSFGYAKHNEYDENGKIIRITYLDETGKKMMTKQGYAIIDRFYYNTSGPDNGKIESEFYFDDTGKPVSLNLGQFGVHKEYDEKGQISALIYLDAKGNPIVTTKGYTIVLRTVSKNGIEVTEKYLDIEWNPIALSEGQYGIKQIYGKTIYLDRDGKEIFNLKNLLYNHSWLAVFISIVVVVISMMISRKTNMILGCFYVIVVIYFTLMFRENEGTKNVEVLGYYKRIFESSEARADILKNIWLFVPLGAILYHINPRKTALLLPIVLSIIIEVIQYISGTGFCELDDVISNSFGGGIGYLAGKLTTELKQRIHL